MIGGGVRSVRAAARAATGHDAGKATGRDPSGLRLASHVAGGPGMQRVQVARLRLPAVHWARHQRQCCGHCRSRLDCHFPGRARGCRRSSSCRIFPEGIYHPQTTIVLLAAQVFRIDRIAPKGTGRRQNCAIPIRQLETSTDYHGGFKDIHRHILYRKSCQCLKKIDGVVGSQRLSKLGACRTVIKFLEHLHRERQVISRKQIKGNGALARLFRSPAGRIKKDVGVNKPCHGWMLPSSSDGFAGSPAVSVLALPRS